MLPFVDLLQYRSIRPYVRFSHCCSSPLTTQSRYIFDHELILVTQGRGQIETDQGTLPYAEGTLLLIPPGIVHNLQDDEGVISAHIAIHYDWEQQIQEFTKLWVFKEEENESIPPSKLSSLWMPQIAMAPRVPDTLIRLIEQVELQFRSQDRYRILMLQSTMLQLLFLLAQMIQSQELKIHEIKQDITQTISDTKTEGQILDFVRRLHELVVVSPFLEYQFKALCESTHFSKAHFRRLFKEQMGLAPHAYFNMLRLRKASQLLLDTKLSVPEISYLCGYEDPKYFGRVFRQTEGVTPLEYRNTLVRDR